jgi:hypothetical protein
MEKNVIGIKKDKITKRTTFCGKYNRGYAPCLKNIVNFLVVEIYNMNFVGCFPTCICIWECRFLKG